MLGVYNASLVSYIKYAEPWVAYGQEESMALVKDAIEDQERSVKVLGERILELGGIVQPGAYPLTFTSFHDVSLDYLLNVLLVTQQDDIDVILQCVNSLEVDTRDRAIAEEILGNAQAHLETFQEIVSGETADAS
tara:strand:+ start:330 stop:734 length:405 start_codon:yes stop_codon:yes gene_type:complete